MAKKTSFFDNTRKPEGLGGRLMVCSMNMGHGAVSAWGLSQLPDELHPLQVADLGCGGGRSLSRLLNRYPEAACTGLDYAEVSVEKTKKYNQKAVKDGRLQVVQGDVSRLPFEAERFDLITAFETVYFWPGPAESFQEVFRVLKKGGCFLIVNESSPENEKDRKWVEIIEEMQLLSREQLQEALQQAGFEKVTVFRKENTFWTAFLAEK